MLGVLAAQIFALIWIVILCPSETGKWVAKVRKAFDDEMRNA